MRIGSFLEVDVIWATWHEAQLIPTADWPPRCLTSFFRLNPIGQVWAQADRYRFSSLILGIVKSVPFQMRRSS